MNITHINQKTATTQREQLIQALGSENNESQWLVFMYTIKDIAPFLCSSAGSPTKEQISHSFIGQLGFKSFKHMRLTKVSEGGLNLNDSKWEIWSKAFKTVEAHPYLAELELTANAIAKKTTAYKNGLPSSREEFEQSEKEMKDRRQQEKQSTMSNMKLRITELEQELIAANAKIEAHDAAKSDLTAIVDSVAQLKAESAALSTKCEELQLKNNELEYDSRVSQARYADLQKRLSSMTLWQRIKADFNI